MKQQLHKRVPVETVEALFREYQHGRMSRTEVCRYLQIGKTRFFELYKRFLRADLGSDAFSLYKARERPTREFSPEIQRFLRRELRCVKSLPPEKRNFNFEVIAEEVHKRCGRKLHRNCIRRFAIRQGYYDPHQEKPLEPYKQFEMCSVGMMFQHDDCEHLWVPALERRTYLIGTTDDHSRLILKGTLVEHAGTWEHMKHAEAICKKYGLAAIWYLDKHSIFTYRFAHRSIWRNQNIADEGETQFALMMAELGIYLRFAPTAHAKGKIENKFRYLQARIPYLCMKRGVSTISEGQAVVDEVIEYYNTKHVHEEIKEVPLKRWERAIQEGRCCLRPASEVDWDHVSAFKCSRRVDGYGTLSYRGHKYKLRKIRDKRVTVCEKPDEKIAVYDDKQKIATFYFKR